MTEPAAQTGDHSPTGGTRLRDAAVNGLGTVRRAARHAAKPYPVRDLPDGRSLELPGRGTTYITESGPADAPTVFLLHGVSTSGVLCWYPSIPALNRDFHVVTIDHRWHGRGIRSAEFSLDDCADDVVAVADQLGVERFTAAGFSMGGGIAQLAWQRHRDRVGALVLCSTGPFFSSLDPERLAAEERIGKALKVVDKVLPTPAAERLDDWQGNHIRWAFAQMTSTNLGDQGEFAGAMARFDSRPWLSEIDVPTAVVVSTRDKIVQPERQQLLVDGIPGARRFDVDGGHACCVLGAEDFLGPLVEAVGAVAGVESPR